MARLLVAPYKLMDYSIYTAYRNYDKIPPQYRVKNRRELIKFLRVICKNIGMNIYTSIGGISIKGLGYFFVWKIPRKMPYQCVRKIVGKIELYNYHTDHHRYTPTFIPSTSSNKILTRWSLDNAFEESIRKGIKDRIMSGFRYKMYAHSVKSINRKKE